MIEVTKLLLYILYIIHALTNSTDDFICYLYCYFIYLYSSLYPARTFNAQKSFLTLTAYIGSLHDLQEIYINCSIFYKTVEKTLCGGTVAKQKRNTR